MIMHDTTMTIPIRNSLFENRFNAQSKNLFKSKKNIQLNFIEVKLSKFKILKIGYKIIKMGHVAWILFNATNDNLVEKFFTPSSSEDYDYGKITSVSKKNNFF